MKATLSRLLSSKFEKSFIQPFIRYHSRFLPLSGTGNLPWPMDYLYLYKHQPGVQCELGPEANIGKVSSVATRMWKSLLQDRKMVNSNHTHERELGKVKSYG